MWQAPEHLPREPPRIGPSAPAPITPADRGFSPPYEISYRGVKLPRVSAAFGRSYLRREADLPQVDSLGPSALISRPSLRGRARPDAGRLCTGRLGGPERLWQRRASSVGHGRVSRTVIFPIAGRPTQANVGQLCSQRLLPPFPQPRRCRGRETLARYRGAYEGVSGPPP